jgi:CO/xanthine dehydrogenase FAD-binding subunit
VGELQWYFPETLEEVPAILAADGVVPHGGGTALLRAGLGQLAGLMDVARLGLAFARLDETPAGSKSRTLALGSALSYAAAAREAAAILGDPRHILGQALRQAATTPLRNRITLGGSLASFPYWSDLLGPLLALEAEVRQIGARTGSWPVGEYVKDRTLRRGSLITEIRIAAQAWRASYHRHTRTPSDRPMFTITVLRRSGARRIEDLRVVVVGAGGRFQRLELLEERLTGQVPRRADPAAALQGITLELPARMGFSSEYLKAVARVELERALADNLRGD